MTTNSYLIKEVTFISVITAFYVIESFTLVGLATQHKELHPLLLFYTVTNFMTVRESRAFILSMSNSST